MSQFERLNASFGQPHGQPVQPPPADSWTYSRNGRTTNHTCEPDPYIFDDEQPSRGRFDDNSLSTSLLAHGLTFTADINFSEFRRDYINCLRAINHVFPGLLLEGTSPPNVVENTA
jgi:hypothetical protein